MRNKELLLQLFVAVPLLTICQMIYTINHAATEPNQTITHDWFFLFSLYLLLHIPVNVILGFVLFAISSWLKKRTASLLVFHIIGLAGVVVLLITEHRGAIYLYSSIIGFSIVSMLYGWRERASGTPTQP